MKLVGLPGLVFRGVSNLALPLVYAKAAIDSGFRDSLPERYGFGDWANLPTNEARPRIWLHAASVGELEGVVPVVQALRRDLPGVELVVTTTSTTGKAAALKRLGLPNVFLLPLDHPRALQRTLERVKPLALIIFETEIWPNLLLNCRDRGVPVMLVNGRISDYSFPRYRLLAPLLAEVIKVPRYVFVQTQGDAERFQQLGVDESAIKVVGSTKYDHKSEPLTDQEQIDVRGLFGVPDKSVCVVAGSVRPEEDEEVIRAFKDASETVKSLSLIIAPRHPERFNAVADLLTRYELSFFRRSNTEPTGTSSVVLLDTLGELRRAYSVADIAFVGGSLVDIGGHNPFEPAMYRCPVIMGPYVSNVRDAVHELKTAGGLLEVSGAEELSAVLKSLGSDSSQREALGERAYQVWSKNSGATDRILSKLFKLLPDQYTEHYREARSTAAQSVAAGA